MEEQRAIVTLHTTTHIGSQRQQPSSNISSSGGIVSDAEARPGTIYCSVGGSAIYGLCERDRNDDFMAAAETVVTDSYLSDNTSRSVALLLGKLCRVSWVRRLYVSGARPLWASWVSGHPQKFKSS